MIPIADNITSRRQPFVNYFLLGINIALFLWELKLEVAGELGNFIQSWGVVPSKITTVTSDAFAGDNPAAWIAWLLSVSSLLTAIFIHSSFSQILGNLLFLFVFGKNVEDILGHGRYLVFYLFCGILTGVGQILVAPKLAVPLAGANGAIASVLGAYLLSFPKAKVDTILPLVILFIPIELPAWFYLFWWFVQQVFYSFGQLNASGGANSVDIAYWAHGTGLVIGVVLMLLLRRRGNLRLTAQTQDVLRKP